ncbi:MAG TPA: ANTAR domain-containing protein [Bryobacteraceae bacterium]|nr:ANTAR domain-containing protein [Bryobacteraceae bacterium]
MPFERSLETLLELIRHTLKADTVTLRDSEEPWEGSGTAVLVPLASPRFCLGVTWRGIRPDSPFTEIGPLIEAMALILMRIEAVEELHQLIVEATNLEWELADSKITDRAAGMLSSGEADAQKVRQHVLRVLEPIPGISVITDRIDQLKAELADREDLAAAKKLLQSRQGLTEDEAYLHLQRSSRRTRRTISEVAREILGAENGRRIA